MLYDLSLPKVMMLYAIQVPQGPLQMCCYDNGMGDVLPVPLGTIAFVSSKTMFDMLLRKLQSIAVHTRIHYMPLCLILMSGWLPQLQDLASTPNYKQQVL